MNDTYIENKVQEMVDEFQAHGAEFLGSIVWVSVRLEDEVPLRKIRNFIVNSNHLPDEWAPSRVNDLTLYLDTMNELGRSSLKKFDYDKNEIPFKPEAHAGYETYRLYLTKENKKPVAHKIMHFVEKQTAITNDKGEQVDVKIEDIEADEGIRIILCREEGTRDDDYTGESKWKIGVSFDTAKIKQQIKRKQNISDSEVTKEMIKEARKEKISRYTPFIDTLNKKFEEKRDEKYDSKQVRELILNDILLDKMEAKSINRGIYFVEKEDVCQLEALSEGLKDIDSGINIFVNPVPRFPDSESLNGTFHSVSDGLTEEMKRKIKSLKEELKDHLENDKDTRPSTWKKRRDDLKDLKDQVKKFRSQKLIQSEMMDDEIEDCKEMIKEGIA